jgi:hypothetical protein
MQLALIWNIVLGDSPCGCWVPVLGPGAGAGCWGPVLGPGAGARYWARMHPYMHGFAVAECVVICRVILGHIYVPPGPIPWPGMAPPPRLETPPCRVCDVQTCHHEDRFSSAVSKSGKRGFILFDDFAAYPEFVVHY